MGADLRFRPLNLAVSGAAIEAGAGTIHLRPTIYGGSEDVNPNHPYLIHGC